MADTLTRIVVSGTYQDPNQPDAPVGGKIVQFTPTVKRILNANGDVIGVPGVVSCVLDDAGHFSVPLVATNSPNMVPTTWKYKVTEPFGGAPYEIPVPFDSPGGVLDLVNVAPAE